MANDRGTPVVSEEFTLHDLYRVRVLVTDAARLVGLPVTDADNLVVAASEIAANAILYGGGKGRVTVETGPDGVWVEISDNGPGLPVDLPAERPAPDAVGGRGLWLARRLCHRMTVASDANGVTVRMFAGRSAG